MLEINNETIHDDNALSQERALGFSYLTEIFIPAWSKKNKSINTSFKAWNCTAANGLSTLALSAYLQQHHIACKILATEGSSEVLNLAQNGVYRSVDIERIPYNIQDSISLGRNEVAGWVKFKDNIFNSISFQKHKLEEPAYLAKDLFDVIIAEDLLKNCKDVDLSEFILEKISRSLKLNGILITDGAIRIPHFLNYFEVVAPGVFKKILQD